MRQLCVAAAVLLLAGSTNAIARAEKVEIKGVHLCCPQCAKVVGNILGKVEGVSDAACDRETKTVTFTATDAKTAKKAFESLVKGGFYGKATCDGKALQIKAEAPKGKVNSVTVNDVHVCCNACRKAIQKLFTGATITYDGKGAQRNVTIAADNLEPAAVLETLRNAGFNGTIRKE